MSSTPTTRPPIRHVICLDGTWNNPAKEKTNEDGDTAYKPTNVLKTARATLTADSTLATITLHQNPVDGQTLSLDNETYRFSTTLEDTANQVQIGARPADTLKNLRYAVNERRHRGRYSKGTKQHPRLRAGRVPHEPRRIVFHARSGTDASSAPYQPVRHDFDPSAAIITDRAELAEVLEQRGYDSRQPITQVTYYDIGVGGARRYPGFSNYIHQKADKWAGGSTAAGFEANIEDAFTYLSLNFQEGDEIYLFGFSRGAASVRGLANFIQWMGGLLQSNNAYYTPLYYAAFLKQTAPDGLGAKDALIRQRVREHLASNPQATPQEQQAVRDRAIEGLGTTTAAQITFLGVWDTVLAISEKRAANFIHPAPPENTKSIRHALAIDERRANFSPSVWTRRATPAQDLQQRWFAGVHTDVGGGYTTATLSNIPLRWVLEGAQHAGLGLDWDYLSHYPKRVSACQHESKTLKWKVLDLHWVRPSHGTRKITTDAAGGIDIHSSALQRIASDEATICSDDDRKTPRLYRPKNLIDQLRSIDNLGAYLAEKRLADEDRATVLRIVSND